MNRTIKIFVLIITCALSAGLQALQRAATTATMKNLNIKPNIVTRSLGKTGVPAYCPPPVLKTVPSTTRTFATEGQEKFKGGYEGNRAWEEKTSRGSEFFEKHKGGIGLGVAATAIGGAYYLSGKEQREVIAEEWKALEGTAQKYRELARNAAPNSSEALLYEFGYLSAQGKFRLAADKLVATIDKIKEEERQAARDAESAQHGSFFERLSTYGASLFTASPRQKAINIINNNHLLSLAIQTTSLNHLQSAMSGKQIAQDVGIMIAEALRGSVAQRIQGPLVPTDSLVYIAGLLQVIDNKAQLKDIRALETIYPGFVKRLDEFWVNPSIESYNEIARAIAKQVR